MTAVDPRIKRIRAAKARLDKLDADRLEQLEARNRALIAARSEEPKIPVKDLAVASGLSEAAVFKALREPVPTGRS